MNAARSAIDEGLDLARAMPYPWAEARLLLASARLTDRREEIAQRGSK
jgi:hypothetical protein